MTTSTPRGLRWVDELPPANQPAPPLPHAKWAAALRSRPGRYAALKWLPASQAGLVSGAGACAPYRPRGSFETEVRGGIVYARYVGTGDNR